MYIKGKGGYMRMLMEVKIPHAQFNAVLKSGNASKILDRILEECRPEMAYFTEQEGCRGAVLVVNVDSPSDIPRLAEPWFLSFEASVQFKVAMTADDLRNST